MILLLFPHTPLPLHRFVPVPLPLFRGFFGSLVLLPPFSCVPLSTISFTLPVSSSSSSSFSLVLQVYLSAPSFFSCSLRIFSSTSSCVNSSLISPFNCSASSTLFLCSSLCVAAPILIFVKMCMDIFLRPTDRPLWGLQKLFFLLRSLFPSFHGN